MSGVADPHGGAPRGAHGRPRLARRRGERARVAVARVVAPARSQGRARQPARHGRRSAPGPCARPRRAAAAKRVDSALGLDGPRAWRLRDLCADLWPGAVLKSLGGWPGPRWPRRSSRGSSRATRANLSVLKNAAAVDLAAAHSGETRAA
jgi:hypothetical protein